MNLTGLVAKKKKRKLKGWQNISPFNHRKVFWLWHTGIPVKPRRKWYHCFFLRWTKSHQVIVFSLSGSFARLSVVFSFKRRLDYFVSSVFSPTVTLVILSWCCFWINRHAVPARVSLGITTILTSIVLSGSMNQEMPQVSYIKAQDYFLLVSFGFIFVSFLEYMIVLNSDPRPVWFGWLRSCCVKESGKVSNVM